jgi:BON domain-containing protein
VTAIFPSSVSEVDGDIARRVVLFLAQRHLVLPKDLSISVQRGVATLRGSASTFHHRQLLVSAAQRVAGVVQIVDELEAIPTIVVKRKSYSSPQTLLSVASVLAVLVAALLAGCGRSGAPRVVTHPAKGAVTYQGQPVVGAFLALHSKSGSHENAPTPTAIVRPDGTFALTTYDAGDGVPEGEYVVTLQWRKATKSGSEFSPGPNLLPDKYSRPETSDIIVRIAAGQNELPAIALRR